jgi:hypothetical protein
MQRFNRYAARSHTQQRSGDSYANRSYTVTALKPLQEYLTPAKKSMSNANASVNFTQFFYVQYVKCNLNSLTKQTLNQLLTVICVCRDMMDSGQRMAEEKTSPRSSRGLQGLRDESQGLQQAVRAEERPRAEK